MNQDVIALHDGTILQVHHPLLCEGQHCCVHRPSDHPLRDAPLRWISLLKIMARECEHGVWHPDPDDRLVRELTSFSALVVLGHNCDGCCVPRNDDDAS